MIGVKFHFWQRSNQCGKSLRRPQKVCKQPKLGQEEASEGAAKPDVHSESAISMHKKKEKRNGVTADTPNQWKNPSLETKAFVYAELRDTACECE